MKTTYLRRSGLVLMIAEVVGVAMTAAGMFETYRTQASSSASALAEGISSSLPPSIVGGLLFSAGLILLLLGWWRGRSTGLGG